MRIHLKKLLSVAAVAIVALASPFASADSIVTGSGTWDTSAPITSYSAPGATWQFVFRVADPVPDNNISTPVSYYQFILNGTVVSTTLPGGAAFYIDSDPTLGGFDLYTDLNNSSPDGVNVVSLYLPVPSLNLVNGTFNATIGLNDGDLPGSGSGTVVVASTPEPSSFILLSTAVLLGGSLLYVRRSQFATQPVRRVL